MILPMLQPGSDVLAPWAGEPNLYPAVVVRLSGDVALVAYWEGDAAQVPVAQLRVATYAPGERVSVNWKNQGQYWPAVIVERVGGAVHVQYDSDGSTEWTTWAKCRVPV
jgi:hypothetical protein